VHKSVTEKNRRLPKGDGLHQGIYEEKEGGEGSGRSAVFTGIGGKKKKSSEAVSQRGERVSLTQRPGQRGKGRGGVFGFNHAS